MNEIILLSLDDEALASRIILDSESPVEIELAKRLGDLVEVEESSYEDINNLAEQFDELKEVVVKLKSSFEDFCKEFEDLIDEADEIG